METARIRLNIAPDGVDRSYEILIRDGLLEDLPLPESRTAFIVTDSNVADIYGRKLLGRLSGKGRKVRMISFPAGERSKSIRTAWKIASQLGEMGATRQSLLLALGGGVVGDLAGFVASIYMRGVDYFQIPTTLLAQVDSSIGGKTGIDAPWGKNQIGTFYQPRGVFTDPRTLETLSPQEILNGLAEIVKSAIIADRGMFLQLSKMKEFDSKVPSDLILRTCKIKAEVVSKDEKEVDYRAVLNFGHTIGHALETYWGYRRSHGFCVVLGMMTESWIASKMGILRDRDFEEQAKVLLRLSRYFAVKPPVIDKRALFEIAKRDKKSTSSSVRMSLPAKIGTMYLTEEGSYTVPVSREIFEGSIDHLQGLLK
jgi:3-dehydroquinate synthase